nr:hypothetical protein [uncultured Allomuricauda sp.]
MEETKNEIQPPVNHITVEVCENGFTAFEDNRNDPLMRAHIGRKWVFQSYGALFNFIKENMIPKGRKEI